MHPQTEFTAVRPVSPVAGYIGGKRRLAARFVARIATIPHRTCEPNEMMATIHERMPVILHRADYERWLSDEPDPSDLLVPFPAELMKMWPIGSKVGKSTNNTPDLLDSVEPIVPGGEPPKGDLFD